MNRRVKPLLLSLLAAMVVGSGASAPAAAETGGHFVSETSHTLLSGSQVETIQLRVPSLEGIGGTISCTEASFEATASTSTVTAVSLTPKVANCTIVGGGKAEVHFNGCYYEVTIRKLLPDVNDNTVHLKCPSEKAIEITLPNVGCKLTFHGQTPTGGGVVYTAGGSGKTHYVLANITVSGLHHTRHGGLCVFVSTAGTDGILEGSASIEGKDTEGGRVGITATGVPAFRSEVSHTSLTGSQTVTNKFTFGFFIGTTECEVATFDGTIAAAPALEITLKPAYSKCTGLERELTTHMNGCAYVLKVTEASTADGAVSIECPSGQAIETTVDKFPEGCTLTIGAQTPKGVVDYKSEGSGSTRDLLLTWTLEGITYTRDGCDIEGESSNGTYTGAVTLQGEDTSGNQKGIWVE